MFCVLRKVKGRIGIALGGDHSVQLEFIIIAIHYGEVIKIEAIII